MSSSKKNPFCGLEPLSAVDFNELENKLMNKKLHILWGTATTSRPHVGYLVPLLKLTQLLKCGAQVTILLADVHALLDNQKSTWDMLESRSRYYELLLKNVLKNLGAPMEQVKFIRGSDYQLTRNYMLDVHRLASLVTEDEATQAGKDVVKQVKHPTVGGLLYPILHCLDEQFLDVDVHLGGKDQRKLFEFSEKYSTILGFPRRVHLTHILMPGLAGGDSVMSSSDDDSKIDLLDAAKVVKSKISKKAYCAEGDVSNNSVLELAEHVIFPIYGRLDIDRPEKFGGPLSYVDYTQMKKDFEEKKLHPGDLKSGVESSLNRFLDKIRFEFESQSDVLQAAYPSSSPIKSTKSPLTNRRAVDDSILQESPLKQSKSQPPISDRVTNPGDVGTSEKIKSIVRYLQDIVAQEKHEALARERNIFVSKLSQVISDLETSSKLSDHTEKANLQTRVSEVSKQVVTYDHQLRDELEKRPKFLLLLNNFINVQKNVLRESEKQINLYKAKLEAVTKMKSRLISSSSNASSSSNQYSKSSSEATQKSTSSDLKMSDTKLKLPDLKPIPVVSKSVSDYVNSKFPSDSRSLSVPLNSKEEDGQFK